MSDGKPDLRTGIKFEPRRTKDGRVVLRPSASAVTFVSSDSIILTLHLPDIDLAQIGAIFVFPPQNGLNMRTAGDPLSSLPPRMGQLLNQSATPLFLYTEYVAYVTATDLPEHEGPALEMDIVAEQQAHLSMQIMAQSNQPKTNDGSAYISGPITSGSMMFSTGRINANPHAGGQLSARTLHDALMDQQRQAAAQQFPCVVAQREHP